MPPSRHPQSPPAECPVCGEDLPPRARACPHCGADEKTGWDENATRYDGLDLPASAFTDDSSAPVPPRALRKRPHPLIIVVAILLILLLGARALGLR